MSVASCRLILILLLLLFAPLGCRSASPTEPTTLAQILKSYKPGDEPRHFSGEGYMSLAFERMTVCDLRDRATCAAMNPTKDMILHREAYNRNAVTFEGVVRGVEEGGFCARDCDYPVIEVAKVESPETLLSNVVGMDDQKIDSERVVFDGDVTDYQGLKRLGDDLLARLDNPSQLAMFVGLGNGRADERIAWIARVLKMGSAVHNLHFAQVRDDLDPSQLSDDGVVCLCLRSACERGAMRLDVTNQSITDAFLCLPVSYKSGQWAFDSQFFTG